MNAIISEMRGKKRVSCDFFEGLWVEFYEDMTIADAMKADEQVKAGNEFAALEVVAKSIVDWNFYETQDQKLPISAESLTKIPTKFLNWLIRTQKEIFEETKAAFEVKKN